MALSNETHTDVAILKGWHASLSPLKVDLVGDFAGKELFAIHGDALMWYCITQANVDLTGKTSHPLSHDHVSHSSFV